MTHDDEHIKAKKAFTKLLYSAEASGTQFSDEDIEGIGYLALDLLGMEDEELEAILRKSLDI